MDSDYSNHILVIISVLLVSGAVYALLTRSYHRAPRHLLIAVVTFIPGLYFFLEFVLPAKIGWFEFGRFNDQISQGLMVVGAMAIGLGVINIMRVHLLAIIKTRPRWGNSLALLLGFLLMLVVEGRDMISSEQMVESVSKITTLQKFSERILEDNFASQEPPAKRLNYLLSSVDSLEEEMADSHGYLSLSSADDAYASEIMTKTFKNIREKAIVFQSVFKKGQEDSFVDLEALDKAYVDLEVELKTAAEIIRGVARKNYEASTTKAAANFLKNSFYVPLGAAMFSLLAFYISVAAYRSFRLRSLEALVMMIAALVVMLGQIPHGPLYVSSSLPDIRLWLLKNLSTPAFRAIFFGTVVAGLAWAVRMWLSLERSPLVDEDTA